MFQQMFLNYKVYLDSLLCFSLSGIPEEVVEKIQYEVSSCKGHTDLS